MPHTMSELIRNLKALIVFLELGVNVLFIVAVVSFLCLCVLGEKEVFTFCL